MTGDSTKVNRFPFRSTLNLRLLIDFWEQKLKEGKAPFFASQLLEKVASAPEIRGPIDDINNLSEYKDLIEILISAVIPPGLEDFEMAAAVVPFKSQALYATSAFNKAVSIDSLDETATVNIPGGNLSVGRTIQACLLILHKFYHVNADFNKPVLITIQDEATGLQKVYKVVSDMRFCEVIPKGELAFIDPGVLKFMTEKIYDLDLWLKYIRPEDFEFQGLMLIRLTDVTQEEMVSSMKYDLLKKDAVVNPVSFKVIQQKLRSVFSMPDLMLGLAYFDPNNNLILNSGYEDCWKSLTDNPSMACDYAGSIYERSWTEKRIVTIDNLANYPFKTKVEDGLLSNNIQSVLLAPLVDGHETIGLLELASSQAGKLNPISATKVESVLPMFTMAVKRVKSDMEMEVRALIQEECTAIHPSVQWRFFDAGVNLMNTRRANPAATLEEIKFTNVFPFFGLTDIRNSSVERNAAILDDLYENLKMAIALLREIYAEVSLPIVEELIFKTESNLTALHHNLATGDEITVLEFLRKEVNPIINHFSSNSSLTHSIAAYNNSLDPTFGVVYKRRREFEESLSRINNTIGSVIDEADDAAQQIFPHYFEKYKTDGVEFTLYVGESLVKNKKFDEFYVRNFRLWQLLLMCNISNALSKLKPDLKKKLDVTQLILVHDQPVTISFRQDEKRFDVDGAYDIRYEIVKKRIDKAYIKNTRERLTQPGKIAIVYSQPKVATEYKQYFNYLFNKDLITEAIEEYELEELPGANGLKALRITLTRKSDPGKADAHSLVEDIEKVIDS
ncbi:MAG TPA: GAF domain-containing protein [Cyclobacteriaceae bacterium]|nr:GAF domain-containing protein [Cyclobacteriaceae bacterium]